MQQQQQRLALQPPPPGGPARSLMAQDTATAAAAAAQALAPMRTSATYSPPVGIVAAGPPAGPNPIIAGGTASAFQLQPPRQYPILSQPLPPTLPPPLPQLRPQPQVPVPVQQPQQQPQLSGVLNLFMQRKPLLQQQVPVPVQQLMPAPQPLQVPMPVPQHVRPSPALTVAPASVSGAAGRAMGEEKEEEEDDSYDGYEGEESEDEEEGDEEEDDDDDEGDMPPLVWEGPDGKGNITGAAAAALNAPSSHQPPIIRPPPTLGAAAPAGGQSSSGIMGMFKGMFDRQGGPPAAGKVQEPPRQSEPQQQRDSRPALNIAPPSPSQQQQQREGRPAEMLPARKIAPTSVPQAPKSRQHAQLLGELVKAKISDPDAVMLVAESSKEAQSKPWAKQGPVLDWSLLSDINKSVLAFCK